VVGRMAVIGTPIVHMPIERQTGAQSAGRAWMAAVVQSGRHEGYDFFVPTVDAVRLRQALSGDAAFGRAGVRIRPLGELAEAASREHYCGIHDIRFSHHLSRIRSLLQTSEAGSRTPVSVSQYGMNYPDGLSGVVWTAIAGAHPWDAIVCLSTASLKMHQSMIESVRCELPPAVRAGLPVPSLVRIPFGVDVEAFRPPTSPDERGRIRAKWRLPRHKVVVLQVARLNPYDKLDWSVCLRLGSILQRLDAVFVLAGAASPQQATTLSKSIRDAGWERAG